jgi:hypothetical protein
VRAEEPRQRIVREPGGFILERTDYRSMFTTTAATVAIGAIAFALWDRDP